VVAFADYDILFYDHSSVPFSKDVITLLPGLNYSVLIADGTDGYFSEVISHVSCEAGVASPAFVTNFLCPFTINYPGVALDTIEIFASYGDNLVQQFTNVPGNTMKTQVLPGVYDVVVTSGDYSVTVGTKVVCAEAVPIVVQNFACPFSLKYPENHPSHVSRISALS
jgi:hypothetical protein